MTAVATRPRAGAPAAVLSLLDGPVGGEPTLEEVLSGAWEELAAHRAVPCPVCGGRLGPEYGPHALPVGGACGDCGSRLS